MGAVPVIIWNIFGRCKRYRADDSGGNQEGYLTQFLHVSPLDQMKSQKAARNLQTKVNLKQN
jgi:hypothetical protein